MKIRKKKILIIEDTLEIMLNLEEFLQMEGFKTTKAGNGEEALLKLNKRYPI